MSLDYYNAKTHKAVPVDAVVLDPEKAGEHLGRHSSNAYVLRCAVESLRASQWVSDTNLAEQIEAQSSPPKPAEPSAFGAIVADPNGIQWFHWTAATGKGDNWQRRGTAIRRTYDDIDVAEVLFDGVTRP